MDSYFFIIGAQRSGSTYLYNMLDQHPEICMAKPIKPEPKFFLLDNLWDKGLDYYKRTFYNACDRQTVFGEKSVSYYESEKVAQRISQCFPKAKLVFIVRNPVFRAISNYKFSYENGLEKRTIQEALMDNVQPLEKDYTTSVSPYNYLQRGQYIEFIDSYLKYFSASQIYVGVFEELVGQLSEIKNIYAFLNVSSDFVPAGMNTKINASKTEINYSEETVVEFLKNYYSLYNKRLEEYLNRTIFSWH